MTMEKKVYIAPAIELFDIESEGCLLTTSPEIGTGNEEIKDEDGDGYLDGVLSNKRQPNNAPWSSSPWE